MKRVGFLFVLLLCMAHPGQRAAAQESGSGSRPVATVVSPTDVRIADDRRQILAAPARFQPYNDLALVLLAKSKESTDSTLSAQAEQAFNNALRLAPDNIQVLKTRVVLLLAKHEFAQARSEAKVLNSRMPDDVSLYGYLATADIELSNYDEAEKEAQWMLNLLPNNVPGLLIGARLREIYGDAEGALEFLNQAYSETPAAEIQELADIGDRIARVQIKLGKMDVAAQILEQVLQTFPGYPAAVEDLSKVRTARGGPLRESHSAPSVQPPPLSAVEPPVTASEPLLMSPPASIPRQLLSPKPTESDRIIRNLQSRISHDPGQYKLYAELGAAFFQKARETGDVSHFELAEQALGKSLDLVSGDLAAAGPAQTLAAVYMGEHRFADALASAEKSLSLGSGDPSPFTIVGDACADMGEYGKAAEAYAKLQAGYSRDSRVAFLKFVSGDTAAAIQLMQRAIARGAGSQLPGENLAWLYYELGEFSFQNGNITKAGQAYFTSLTIHPGDYRALAGLAKVRAAQARPEDAIDLYKSALAVVPMPQFAAELGDVYAKLGRLEDAGKQFRLVDYMGTLGAINKVLHNRDLALYYADHGVNLPRALELAQKEFEVRHDIYTWDVLAWALYKNGKLSDAADAITKALSFGTKDAMLFFHAGMIYHALGEETKAKEYLSQALAINPHFHVAYADAARRQLAELEPVFAQSGNGKAGNAQ